MRGPTINLFIKGFVNDCWIDRNSVYLRASWMAKVGKMRWRLLRSSKSQEQKKEAPSCPFGKILSATACAMVGFPVPANPFSQ